MNSSRVDSLLGWRLASHTMTQLGGGAAGHPGVCGGTVLHVLGREHLCLRKHLQTGITAGSP